MPPVSLATQRYLVTRYVTRYLMEAMSSWWLLLRLNFARGDYYIYSCKSGALGKYLGICSAVFAVIYSVKHQGKTPRFSRQEQVCEGVEGVEGMEGEPPQMSCRLC